ncbi:hypothetical protein E2P81_ATG03746 [Venturia nashicola]|uniref:Uncharacterized protein n=1 Tax=Venturia nashicola TaxID=86259 RepID=A0A4Z1PC61_9PEZI|nr:hypothetical protein E6O75_ATG03831 [Venturia nashicola]TLD38071.1 hypothetical protein E2P81_ATG03746 [Venturia nashicola]
MGKRAASNSFEQQSSCKQGVLASESCKQQSICGKNPHMKRLVASSDAPAMTNLGAATRRIAKMRKARNIINAEKGYTGYHPPSNAELQDQIMSFMVKEQELEDLTRPKHNLTSSTFPIAPHLAQDPTSVVHANIDVLTQDIDVDMCIDNPLLSRNSSTPPSENSTLMKDTDTDMDALMNSMECLDLKVRKRRGAMSAPSNMPFTRQRC